MCHNWSFLKAEVSIREPWDLAPGHDPWSHGLGTERKGLVPKKLAEESSESRNLRGFLIERESQRMKTECFIESYLFMIVVGFVKD
jgi:hypothetical protein